MSNKRWNPLPPISRTPSPPPHILRRLQSYGGGALTALNEDPEDPEWGDEGPSTPAATGAEPPRKKHKTKKRFLSSRKDPAGKWRRRKERQIGRAVGKEEEDEGMLDCINVAGGVLMIGEGSGKPRVPPSERETGKKNQGWGKSGSGVKGKGRAGKAAAGSKRKGRVGPSKMEVPSLESRITYPKEKTTLKQGGALEVSEFDQGHSGGNAQIPELLPREPPHLPGDDTPMPDLPHEIPSSIPSSDSGTLTPPNGPTLKLTGPAPPEPPPNPETPVPTPLEPKIPSVPPSVTWSTAPSPPPPNPHLNDLAKQLIFHICAFPDLRRTWTISGRDLCPTTITSNNNFPTRPSSTPASPTTTTFPASASPPALETTGAGPSYITLSLILTRKLSIPVTPSSRILINYTFIISTQEDLDICMAQLIYYARPIHDIILVSTGDDPKAVINAMRSRDSYFWKGRKKGSQLPGAALIAAETSASAAEVSTNRRDWGAGGGKRTSSGRGRGKEGSKDGRVLSSEFVEPEDDYSENEDMGMKVEAPDSISSSPAGLTALQVVGTLGPGVEKERQKVARIPPAPTAPRSGSLFEVEMEKVTSTTSTRSSTQGGSTKKLTAPVPTVPPGLAAPKRQQETRKETEEEAKPPQKPPQTQYAGHALGNECSNPSLTPTPAHASGSAKRKLEDYFGSMAKPVSPRSKRGTPTAAFGAPQSPASRWRSGVVEVGTQTGTPTRVAVGDAITIVGSCTNEWKGKGKSKILTTPSTCLSKVNVPPGVAEEGRQKTPQKAPEERTGESNGNASALIAVQNKNESSTSPENLQISVPMPPEERTGESSGNVSALVAVQQKNESPAPPEKLQISVPMPLVIPEKQTYDPAPRVEGPDNPDSVVPLEAIGVRHEAIQSGEVSEKERRGESGGEGPAKVTEPEMAGTAVDSGVEVEVESGPLNNGEEVNRDERPGGGEAGKGKGKEKDTQQPKAQEGEVVPNVAVSGMELAIVPAMSKRGSDPMAAFQAGAGAAETAAGAETETQKGSPVPAPALATLPTLPALPAEMGGLPLSTGEAVRTNAVEESAPSSAPEALKPPSAEDGPLPIRTPSPSPPQSSPRIISSPPTQAHDERFKAFVAAAAAAANHSGSEGRVGNYERAAGSANGSSKATNEQEMSNSPQKEKRGGGGDEDVDMDREFVVHNGRFSVPPMPPTEESGSGYSPSEQDSVTNSTATDIAEKDVLLQWRNDDGDQRSEGTAGAAATLSALEAPPFLGLQPPVVTSNGEVEPSLGEESGQSVDIMHGADLLLWAAGAVDANFGQHVPPPQPQTPPQLQQQTMQQDHEIARAIVAAPPAKGKFKPRKPKDPKEPEVNVAKTKVPKGPQRKSLIVTLKVPSIPNSVDGDSTTPSPPSNGMVTTRNTPPPASPPNLPIPSLGFTPVNTPAPAVTPPIPRPQPYRKPVPRLNALVNKPRTSSAEALAAARKQKEQEIVAKFKGVGTNKIGSNNDPGLVGSSTPVSVQPASITPVPTPVPATIVGPLEPSVSTVQPAPPRDNTTQAVTTPQDIPRPACVKPSSGNAGNPEPPDIDMDHSPTSNDTLPLPQLQPFPTSPRAHLPPQPPTQKFFASVNNGSSSGRNEILDRTPDSPQPVESSMATNENDRLAASIMATLAAGPLPAAAERVIPPTRSPGLSVSVTRQTTPLPLPQRATLTPEYIETKKVVPLVGKNNFLYWDPSMAKGVGGADFKVQIGETVSTSISPITASPALGPRSGSVAGSVVEGRSFYQSPPLRPLSDTVRSTTAPLLQSRAQLVPIPRQSQVQPILSLQIPPQPLPQSLPQQQHPFTPPSVLPNAPLKPADMIFNISRYEKGDQNMIVHGREILADSPETFSWDKLVKLLETGIKFNDFRESLIVNFHHMVEDEAALNEGLRWYRRDNEVVAAKIDSLGKPPKLLAERMKRERKALREKDVCRSPVW